MPNIITPNILATTSAAFTEPWLLITGGRPPALDWLKNLPQFPQIWAADHGIDTCYNANIIPNQLLGDGDSASTTAWQWAKQKAVPTQLYPTAKDLTDTQLAIEQIAAAGANSLIITGAFGGRFDHAFSTMYSCAHSPIPCALLDEQEALFFIKPQQAFTFQIPTDIPRPKAISLLPFSTKCTGVNANNLRWSLAKATLTQQLPNAVSNELLPDENSFTVSIDSGILGVYFYWGKY